MRIAFTIDRLDPAKGGAEAYLDRFGRWLVGRGHEAVLVAREARLSADAPLAVETVTAPTWPRARAERAFALAAAARAEALGADAVLAVRHAAAATVYQPHGGLHGDALAAGIASREPGPSRVLARLGAALSARHRTFLALERGLLGGSEPPRLAAMSRRVEASALRRYPGLAGRTTVVPCGVDLDRFHPRLRAEARASAERELALGSRPLLLFLAHNPRLKGLVPLLRALREASGAASSAHLLVAGRGTGRYAALARRLGLAERTSFRGPLEDPRAWLAASDVLVHPTFHDPCSLVVLEAMACGTPAITTEANGASEIMAEEDGAGAIISSARDRPALVAAIERLADRDAASEAGRRARSIVERHPWERGFRELERLLTERGR